MCECGTETTFHAWTCPVAQRVLKGTAVRKPLHDNDNCTGIAAIDNAKFIAIIVDLFSVEERDIISFWFTDAERSGWIPAHKR